jgi:hypothetical protein
MPRYDYGLRGPRETTEPRYQEMSGRGYSESFDRRPAGRPESHRVTARYNMDYVRPEGPRYPRNPNPFGGGWPGMVGDERAYRQPYMTRGGTWTTRGSTPPLRYDYPDFGPRYGGRYPDEI